MQLDFTSLLLATAISALFLSFTMLAFRLTARSGDFMITWAVGLMIVVVHVLAYWVYVNHPSAWLGALVVVSLPLSGAVMYAAARQFAFGENPVRPALIVVVPYLAVVLPVLAAGYDGTALILQNATIASLLFLCGLIYFGCRHEAPLPMSALAAMYGVLGVSFALCGAVLLFGGEWRIGHAPDNWAERLNVIVAVVAMTAMGALSVTIDQTRLARRHREEAMADPLTGLLNRRALFQMFGERTFGPQRAAIVFDLDHFKRINDEFGHAAGDDVIRAFAGVLENNTRTRDAAARLGGEEFVLILAGTTPEHARATAQRIATLFCKIPVVTSEGAIACTVSAGIGFPDAGGSSFDEVLSRADKQLYEAKRAGRNRVGNGDLRLVG